MSEHKHTAVGHAVTGTAIISRLGYERVYLPLWKVADIPFLIQGDEYYQ